MNIKKRLELVKLVEETYRAYHASSEKHDQLIGAPCQVHKTMPEMRPNQVHAATVKESRTPEMTRPKRASLGTDDSPKDAVGFSLSQFNSLYRNGGYSAESGLMMSRRLKQVNGFVPEDPDRAVRRAEDSSRENTEGSVQIQSEAEYTRRFIKEADKAESSDIQSLKAAIVSLKNDKEAADARCLDCLVTISTLESAITSAQEDTKRLNNELEEGVAKMLHAEEHHHLLKKEYKSLEKELEGMIEREEIHKRDLLETQEELGKLQNHLTEESRHVIQVETALQDLHDLHFQCEEEEHKRIVKSHVEIAVLQKCIRDMYHAQLLEVKWLSDELQSLRFGMRDMLESVNAHPDYDSEGKMDGDQILLQSILKKIEDSEFNLSQEQNEKHRLLFENQVLAAHINQMKQEMSDDASERLAHDQQLNTRMEELLVIQTEKQDLLDINEKLRLESGAREEQEAFLKYEQENLHDKFSKLQEAYTITQNQNSKLCERNGLLMKKLLALNKVKRMFKYFMDCIFVLVILIVIGYLFLV